MRSEARWGNFSWLSMRTLLLSGNDVLTRAFGPSIVNRRRMRWVEAQRVRGIDPHEPIRLRDVESILVLGDPGEMDASQYVLVRDLLATEAPLLLLMSDVVYPAGSLNAWSDAVYLPYFGLPKDAWDTVCPTVAAPDWQVLAMPGNHDWYDGLTGFMFHACGAEILPAVEYSAAGRNLTSRLARRLWQRPGSWDRERMLPLREAVRARLSHDGDGPGAMPTQPGPYFSVELGKDGNGACRLKLVCVDTGVNGTIDVEQALWLRRELAGPELKVLVLGKPLVVNDELIEIGIDHGTPPPAAPEGWRASDLPDTLNELLGDVAGDTSSGETRPGNVIAWLGGDTHNAQRVILSGTRTAAGELEVDASMTPEPAVALVSGGGGAYLSETHTVPLEANGGLKLRTPGGGTRAIAPGEHWRFPSRVQSVQLFGARVGVAIGVIGLIIAALCVLLSFLFDDLAAAPPELDVRGTGLSGTLVTATALGAVALIVVSCFLSTRVPTRWRGLAALPLAVLIVPLWNLTFAQVVVVAEAIAFALVLPVVLIMIPQARAFGAVAHWLPLKRLAAAGAALLYAALAGSDVEFGLLALVAIGAALLAWLVGLFSAWITRQSERRAILGHPALGRTVSVATVVISMAGIAGAYVLVGVLDSALADEARLIATTELFVLAMATLIVMFVMAQYRARQSAPQWVAVLVWAGAIASFVGGLLVWSSQPHGWLRVVLAGSWAVTGAAVVGAGCMLDGRSPSDNDVRRALRARDGNPVRMRRSLRLYRTMAAAGLPKIAEMAEQTKPKFRKSFTTIELQKDTIDFVTFAVDDERKAGQGGHPANPGVADNGSYEVDRVRIRVVGSLEPAEEPDTEAVPIA